VKKIGERAFGYCERLESIKYEGTIAEWKVLTIDKPQCKSDYKREYISNYNREYIYVYCSDGKIRSFI
jgi:hypothetical protein